MAAPSILHDVFRQCTHLSGCSVYISSLVLNDNGHNSYEVPDIVLPHLRQLQVSCAVVDSEVSFFRPPVLPALRDLELNLVQNITSFETLGSRSGFDLTKFSHRYGNPLDLFRLLALMPSLLDLTIRHTFLTSALSKIISESGLVSKLEVLTVNCSSGAPGLVLFDALIEILESRWWPGSMSSKLLNRSCVSRLKQVALDPLLWRDLPSYPPRRFFELIEQCKREGLDITY